MGTQIIISMLYVRHILRRTRHARSRPFTLLLPGYLNFFYLAPGTQKIETVIKIITRNSKTFNNERA